MKFVFSMLMLLAVSAVCADEANVRWNALSVLSNSGLLDDADVRKSLSNADVEIAKVTTAFKAPICSNRAAYEADPIKLANALEARIDAIKKIQVEELARLDAKLLASGQKAVVDAKIANIAINTVDETDEWVQNVRDGVFAAGPLVEQICKEAAK